MNVSALQKPTEGNSLAVQWLGLRASSAGGTGSITGWETKIPHATWHGQKRSQLRMQMWTPSQGSAPLCAGLDSCPRVPSEGWEWSWALERARLPENNISKRNHCCSRET